jgi:hypothetical protein
MTSGEGDRAGQEVEAPAGRSTMSSDGSDLAPKRHPRLWVPGLVEQAPHGELRLGRGVGYAGEGRAFARLRCGRRTSIEPWTHTAWLCARRTLDRRIVEEQGIILPESLIDRDALPHAHRWLREQPLVCISGFGWQQLAEAGVCVYRVALDATGERVLAVEATGGKGRATFLRVRLAALTSRAEPTDLGGLSTIDRLLRFCSDGVLDEQAVVNAFDARSLVEDGYGYRGALEGKLSAIETIERALRPLDALFGQIFERATATRELAERLVDALQRLPATTKDAEISPLGRVRRSVQDERRLPLVEPGVLDGEPVRELVLPAEGHWCVDGSSSTAKARPSASLGGRVGGGGSRSRSRCC